MAPGRQSSQIFNDENLNPPKSSVLKSIIASKMHRGTPSAGGVFVGHRWKEDSSPMDAAFLPTDLPRADSPLPLVETSQNRDAAGSLSAQRRAEDESAGNALHKKTKSSVSLRSLIRDKDKKETISKSPEDLSRDRQPKKTKSSTSLSAIFKRSHRSRKEEASRQERDKENRAPPEQSENMASPTFAQFARQSWQDQADRRYVPQKDRTLDEEMSLYTPKRYSPSKQRNFHDHTQPTLARRLETKPRPRSEYIPSSSFVAGDMLDVMQQPAYVREPKYSKGRNHSATETAQLALPTESHLVADIRNSNAKLSSRVLAAISVFSSKEKASAPLKDLDPKEIETAFEELLVSCHSTNHIARAHLYRTGFSQYSTEHARKDAVAGYHDKS